jgi:hypothetical protein
MNFIGAMQSSSGRRAKNDSARLAGGRANIGRGQQIGNDDDAPRSGCEHFTEVGALDAADAKRGDF